MTSTQAIGVTRVGAIDCGTNSIRLLVADIDGHGALTDVMRQMEIVRLGYGVDRTGVIDEAAMERTLDAAGRYAATCRDLDATAVRFVATSASRDARNAGEFVAGVQDAFAAQGFEVTPEVVSGEGEAQLSFSGATGDVAAAGFPGPYLVIDLGGGSTEFVRGSASVEAARSMDIGCVRITERRLFSDPPTDAEIASAATDIERAIDAAEDSVDLSGIGTIVGLAGSVTTVTAHTLGLTAYQPERIHLASLPAAQHLDAASDLLARSRAQRLELGFMHPGRADVIGAGALIWRHILDRVLSRSPEVQVVTSEHDILDGIALSLISR